MKSSAPPPVQEKVQVWVHTPGPAFLLLKLVSSRGSHWQPITGWVDAGESAEAAAARELLEETGISVSIEKVRPLGFEFYFKNRHDGKEVEERCFEVSLSDRPSIKLDASEHQASKWVSSEEAESLLPFEPQLQAFRLLAKKLARGNPFAALALGSKSGSESSDGD